MPRTRRRSPQPARPPLGSEPSAPARWPRAPALCPRGTSPSLPLLQKPLGPGAGAPAPAFRIQVSPHLTPQPEAQRLGGSARVAMATGVYFALGTHSSRRNAPRTPPLNPG